MSTSGNRPFVKRCLEEELGIPYKRLKIDETELFRKNQSDKTVIGVGRGRCWKTSYQRYKSRYYGSRKERNSFKTRIGKKRKEEVDIRDDIEKVDADTIEEIVVWQPTTGSEAFNEGFVSDFNKIEAFGEGGEVSDSVSGEDEAVNISICNNQDEEVLEVCEAWKYWMKTMKIIKKIKNITLKRTIMAMIRDEALDWKLNFGNSELL